MSDIPQLGDRVASGARWIAVSTILASVATWANAIVLARLLDKHTFGLAQLALVAVAIFQLFQDSGLHAALIQRRDRIVEAADAAMLYAPCAGIVLAGACFVGAPLAERFFHEPALRGLVQGLAGVFVLRSLAIVPIALIQRELLFARQAVITAGGSISYFLSAVALAAAGAGAWSVIGGQLVLAGWVAGAGWVLTPVRPNPLRASWRMLRELLRYGRHIVAGNMVSYVNSYTDPVGVGRLYQAESLGAYTLGFNTGSQAVTLVTGVANQLVFPAYAKLQHDLARFRHAYLRSLRFLCMVSPPIAFGLAAVSGVLMPTLYGSRWNDGVPVLAVISFYGLFLSIAATTGEVYKAAGRPELFFRIGAIQVVVQVGLIGALYRFGIVGFAVARAGAALVISVVALVAAGRILALGLADWWKALAVPIAAAAVMGALVYGSRLALSAVFGTAGWQLLPLIAEGTLLYLALLGAISRDRLREFADELRRLVPLDAIVRRVRRRWTVGEGDLGELRAATDEPAATLGKQARLAARATQEADTR